MTPRQQQILAQWQVDLRGLAGEFQGLLGPAAEGCQGLIAQHPTDPSPLQNALGAIRQQADAIVRRVDDAWEPVEERLGEEEEEPEAAELEGLRAQRGYRQWMNETWARFELDCQMRQLHALYPHAQQGLAKPAACRYCGAPLSISVRLQSANVTCGSCQAHNQVSPEPAVAAYFSWAPDLVAQTQTLEQRFAKERFENDWEDRRHVRKLESGEWPDEPIESLKQREKLELDYWTAYATARGSVDPSSPEQQSTFVESRMKSFYDAMAHNEAWRAAHGMGPSVVAVPADARDWGPLQPNAVDDFWLHDCLFQNLATEPVALQKAFAHFGYRDETQWRVVQQTFHAYWGERLSEQPFQDALNRAVMRAMQLRADFVAAENQGLLSPVEGVSIEVYAQVTTQQANLSPDALLQVLAQHQMDRPKWERVSKGWMERMQTDTTGTVSTAFSNAFTAATAASGVPAESITFEQYAEISGAMSAWSKQGKDISAGLDRQFGMSAQDFSRISMHWSTKMQEDFSMYDRLSQLVEHYERHYLSVP